MKNDIKGLYAVIDSTYVAFDDMEKTALEILGAGVRVVQLRAKEAGAAETLKAARAIQKAAAGTEALFIVNDRVDIALLSSAGGVHLGQDDIPVAEARRLLGPESVIGVSTHDAAEALQAEAQGADYISLGPIFPTPTKKDAASPRGLALLNEVRSAVTVPIVAIGGITGETAAVVLNAGASSVAVISAILCSTDIAGAAAGIISTIKRAQNA